LSVRYGGGGERGFDRVRATAIELSSSDFETFTTTILSTSDMGNPTISISIKANNCNSSHMANRMLNEFESMLNTVRPHEISFWMGNHRVRLHNYHLHTEL
jgi:hypothetical protein